jgi:hypothetical protein
MTVSCPSCGEKFQAPDEYAGRASTCVNCGKELTIPAATRIKPLATCRDCGRQVSKNAQACPYCGAPQPAVSSAIRMVAIVVASLVAIVFAGSTMMLFRGCNKEINKPAEVTMAEFNQIQDGMTYRQVTQIIGHPGKELSSTNITGVSTKMYSWGGGAFGSMTAIFQNGRLVTKSQSMLR